MKFKSNIKISQIQVQGLGHPNQNAKLIKSRLLKTVDFNPDLISTPECLNIITNDSIHLKNNAPYQDNCPVLNECREFAKKNKKVIHIGSLLLKDKNANNLLNRSFIIGTDGKIKKIYDKIHLFDVSLNKRETYKESSLFSRGNKLALVNLFGVKMGMTICYDLRFPLLFSKLTQSGAKVIFVPAAFTVMTGISHWLLLLRARAIENSSFIIATAQCGNHHYNRKTYGYSCLIDPWGNLLSIAKSKPKIINASINISYLKDIRKRLPSIKHAQKI